MTDEVANGSREGRTAFRDPTRPRQSVCCDHFTRQPAGGALVFDLSWRGVRSRGSGCRYCYSHEIFFFLDFVLAIANNPPEGSTVVTF